MEMKAICRTSQTILLATALALTGSAAAQAPSIAGWAIDESGCASGGPTTYFFEGGAVIRKGCGDDCPIITEGRWAKKGDEIAISWSRRYFGKGTKRSAGPTPAREMFDEYVAVVEDFRDTDSISWEGPNADMGCETSVRHTQPSSDPRAFLRNGLVGRFPQASQRELEESDFSGLSLEDLKIMRNEIYARYGHTFKDAGLRKHFKSQKGYAAYYTNVGAFLSPIESKNLEKIKAAEKALKGKPE